MKLYTKSGDDGTTGLFGGGRVAKDHPRVEAYGTVDELNASLGHAASACDGASAGSRRLQEIIALLQSRLFDLGADLATPPDSPHAEKIRRIDDADIREVEGLIDEIDGGNEPMRSFILPGGCELASRLHVARTIGRRAERRLVTLSHAAEVNRHSMILLNRMSDLLFAMARRANALAGVDDVKWSARQ